MKQIGDDAPDNFFHNVPVYNPCFIEWGMVFFPVAGFDPEDGYPALCKRPVVGTALWIVRRLKIGFKPDIVFLQVVFSD